MIEESRRLRYWIPAILYMMLIFYLSSRPPVEAAKAVPLFYGIKLVHIIEYGILFYLIRFAAIKTLVLSRVEIFIFSLLLTTIYGISDELHQAFSHASRSASLIDIGSNTIGAISVQLIALIFDRQA